MLTVLFKFISLGQKSLRTLYSDSMNYGKNFKKIYYILEHVMF